MDTPLEFLKATVKAEKLSHAYLFSGNDTEAQIAAALFVADLLKTNEADIVSQELTAIEQVRDLRDRLSLGAWASPFKVAILKNVHKASEEAQSALLKLLEEPKGDTLFFLLTAYPFLLLPTLRSRAQELRFWKFPLEEGKPFKVPASLKERFDYAKELAESEEVLLTLQDWLLRLRHLFVSKIVKEDMQKAVLFSRTLRLVEETIVLLQTTNVNPRLAAERVLLAL
ncbi:MAG: hypothetical protein A2842_01950 [Candidatus Wildermuthbacteria bacterium RIFCSPHIGHO2_01_FULL_48_25]|uniref:DNA polymerase III subunit delta n=1 Tax=Candidatus Wildermuthbacteria bacterium RIFCSPLOWO2_01_FULL_48_16 TaxID=1802461 RepID=A0A1G2RLS3_9BACT|nr:MAG: hypothetical protein A2842_01950 [Candidatus Wildermuthbacteria bacterium RIFCSPHIGHO2_01_FULL_48_25]OHA69267.1 MAG: hypothetical protein A3J57_01800 [Candidatus Wildermuthbacteria bacterium RIFCSPHIGHO2_02_FULL_49_12b]OHA73438.1 MAG: hypothetical protein A3B24_02415 [Candidatus Wildermuthbacteria bacterium RIFCSPLOWO2_01_FULL_48_16]